MVLSGLLGRKLGMTHLFDKGGRVVPVTAIEVGPCVVTQLRTEANDGYDAVQVGYGEAKQLNKPEQGHLKRAGVLRPRRLAEFTTSQMEDYQPGQTINVSQFFTGEQVHVTAISKGRGFQGVVKRFGSAGGPKTHGQRDRHRAPGSSGAGTFPGRVYKGRKMPGHMGSRKVTIRGLRVALVDPDRNLLMVRGAVAGSRNTLVTIRHADMEEASNAYTQFLAAVPPEAPAVEQEPAQTAAAGPDQGIGQEQVGATTAMAAEEAHGEEPIQTVGGPSLEIAEQGTETAEGGESVQEMDREPEAKIKEQE